MQTNLNNLISGQPTRIGGSSGYQGDTARNVKARAGTTDLSQSQSEQEKRGLRRLNSVLNNNEPLREDVPRGYYLNISV